MMNGEQSIIFGRLDNVATLHGRQANVAAQQVQVVVWKKDDISGSDQEGLCIFVVDTDVELPLDDVVTRDQVGCRTEKRGAMLGLHACCHAPRRKEFGMQKHAASQMRHPQDIR